MSTVVALIGLVPPDSLAHGWTWFITHASHALFNPASVIDYLKLAAVTAITFAMEVASRKNWRVRYGSKNFRVDLAYYVFYYSGLYHILIFAWLYRILLRLTTEYASFLQLNLLGHLSPVWQVLGIIVASDLLGYGFHRLMHSNKYLWAFHSIHHSQTTLTTVTNYRFHVVDETLRRIVLFVPAQILGGGIAMWLVLDFAMAWILLIQHSEWNWTYGWFGRLFVSPAFHRKHHSTTMRLQNSNFSMLFTVWDDLFGTADRRSPVPTEYGLADNPVPETLWGQFIHPFKEIARELSSPAEPVPALNPAAAPPAPKD